jgi:hypothetical protein
MLFIAYQHVFTTLVRQLENLRSWVELFIEICGLISDKMFNQSSEKDKIKTNKLKK